MNKASKDFLLIFVFSNSKVNFLGKFCPLILNIIPKSSPSLFLFNELLLFKHKEKLSLFTSGPPLNSINSFIVLNNNFIVFWLSFVKSLFDISKFLINISFSLNKFTNFSKLLSSIEQFDNIKLSKFPNCKRKSINKFILSSSAKYIPLISNTWIFDKKFTLSFVFEKTACKKDSIKLVFPSAKFFIFDNLKTFKFCKIHIWPKNDKSFLKFLSFLNELYDKSKYWIWFFLLSTNALTMDNNELK